MKKIISVILFFILLSGFSIAESLDLSEYTDEQLIELFIRVNEEITRRQQANGTLLDADTDGYHVVLESISVGKNYEDKTSIILQFLFVNNNAKADSLFSAWNFKLFQNNIELDQTWPSGDDENYGRDIKNGAQIRATVLFKLLDTTSPVEITLYRKDFSVTKTFAISE